MNTLTQNLNDTFCWVDAAVFDTTKAKAFYTSIFVILALFFVPTKSFAQVIKGSIEFEGRTREYVIFLPVNYETMDSLPLVLNLHGSSPGFDGSWQMNYTLMNRIADTAGFIVVYPTGISQFGTNGQWYIDVVDPTNGVGFINALLDTLDNLYKINNDQIYACGASDGGNMCNKLACLLSHRIAAIASLAGGISSGVAKNIVFKRPMPVLCIQGTADPMGSYRASEQCVEFWTNLNICSKPDTIAIPDINLKDNSSVEKITYANTGTGCNIILYKVINGGHTWPGSAYDIPEVGNTNRDMNASAEIWNFFKQYKLSELSFLDHDITPLSLIYDLKTLPMFMNFKPAVLMQNGGLNDESEITAAFEIDSSGTIVYESSQVFGEMKSMEKKNFLFDKGHTLFADHYDLMCYSLLADDENVKNDTIKSKIIITKCIDDFESGNDKKWISDYGWGINANSVLYSKRYLSYKNADTTTITFFSSFNLSSLETAFISFSTKYEFNDGDAGYIEVSVDNGQTWVTIGDTFIGTQSEYVLSEIPLELYTKPNIKELMMRFKIINNPYNKFPGWYIDDVTLHPNEKTSTAVKSEPSYIEKDHFVLNENYPNPFNPATKITYSIPKSDFVILKIYNILGQEIQTLVNEFQTAGNHSLTFNAKNLSSGIYFYKIQVGNDYIGTKKMLLMQ